ncbi:DUF2228 domain-containing protein [Catellatospora sp. KI3]|uniref:ADP-ribosylation family protein n=1 Tax=Catellatospora sp. KI3 TaxID=3041620 RepID=UPI0024831F84|nr:ADP-ribosylation family protein [Catellatospora sp. KI3]MDI1463089.1 DUF2228 domain-containing protein [Catellatospora sp. KI3]
MLGDVVRQINLCQLDGVAVTVDGEPILVDGQGWVVEVRMYSLRNYSGPVAHLVLPADADAAAAHVADVLRGLREPGAAAAALDRPLAETFGLPEAVFDENLFDPTPEDVQRRTAALAAMSDRFPAVAERFSRVYGLRLPRHLAVFAAFWDSLDRRERDAIGDVAGLHPWGVSDYFKTDGLALVGRDGLDERLHCRFRRDPAEFVTVLGGDSDGLHFGLWYDDPAQLPSFIAHNWARDSAETWTSGRPTLLGEISAWLEKSLDDSYGEEGDKRWRLHPLRRALDWFAEADAEALRADGERVWADAPRAQDTVSIGAALPPGSGDPRGGEHRARFDAYRGDHAAVRGWIGQARAELAAGEPAFALALGTELHWLDADEFRQEALELQVGAYRALGRGALADIAEVHFAHRDLRTVDVLVAG